MPQHYASVMPQKSELQFKRSFDKVICFALMNEMTLMAIAGLVSHILVGSIVSCLH